MSHENSIRTPKPIVRASSGQRARVPTEKDKNATLPSENGVLTVLRIVHHDTLPPRQTVNDTSMKTFWEVEEEKSIAEDQSCAPRSMFFVTTLLNQHYQ